MHVRSLTDQRARSCMSVHAQVSVPEFSQRSHQFEFGLEAERTDREPSAGKASVLTGNALSKEPVLTPTNHWTVAAGRRMMASPVRHTCVERP